MAIILLIEGVAMLPSTLLAVFDGDRDVAVSLGMASIILLALAFAGKTVIHPNQIPLVNEAYRVNRKDYEDAQNILSWDPSNPTLVSGSVERDRMNEYKTHKNWAEKTLHMGKAYGIRG